ncbi:MAG: OmpH family outer membrane protein [Candidatus Omnitrophota bacterium]
MKKMKILTGIFVIIFLMTASFAQAEVKKVGYLNVRRVFDEYKKTQDYDKILEEQYNKYETERSAMVEKIQERQGKLSLLKEDERQKAEEEIQTMINDLQQYDRAQQTDLTKKRDERIRDIMLEIEQRVGEHAKSQGYDLILNSNVLIWQSEAITDISEDIVTILNSNYQEKK